jgi:hypothetical protein
MDNIRETNLAAKSWNCHLLNGAILSARIGKRGHSSRAVRPACVRRRSRRVEFPGWGST